MARVWHKGPPPHVGWWNASAGRHEKIWRWWNGKYWSQEAYSTAYGSAIPDAASNRATMWGIEWTKYYPRNARVPRVAP